MGQIYKISNNKNNKLYIGISYAKGKTYLDRFEEHMSGNGGVYIIKDIESGAVHPNDFMIEIIEDNNDVFYLKEQETYYIRLYNTLWPNGYNGNVGNFIIQTNETIEKARKKRKKSFDEGKYSLKGIHQNCAVYTYKDGTNKMLSNNHIDVISGIVTHVNHNPNSKYRKKLKEESEQKEKNGGITDKQKIQKELKRILWKQVHKTDWWKKGRETFKNRMKNKDFTEKEKDLYYNRRPNIVRDSWKDITHTDRLIRTSNGLDNMNSKVICEKCGIKTNKGNYSRWHGNKCKKIKN